MYICFIKADGTFDIGPIGWTAARRGLGIYDIVHNLGTMLYLPLPLPANGVDYKTEAVIAERLENTLAIGVYESAQLKDTDVGVLVFVSQ